MNALSSKVVESLGSLMLSNLELKVELEAAQQLIAKQSEELAALTKTIESLRPKETEDVADRVQS